MSQNTVSGEVEEPVTERVPEIAKKVPRVPKKDKKQIEDKSIRKPNYLSKCGNKGETEIMQTSKHLNPAREVYFDLIQMQSMARTKHMAQKRVVREDRRPLKNELGKVPQKPFITRPSIEGEKPKKKLHCLRPGTKVLMEIRRFQKTTDLLIPKRPFYQLVKEILQTERSWLKIQATAIMALHEVAEAYLV